MTSTKPPRVVCLGDCITRGQVSANYVDLLRQRFPAEYVFVNRGVNHDLAYSVRNRLDQVVADEPDHVTVLVGTNDANATLSDRNRRLMTRIKRLPTTPTAQWYRDNLTGIVRVLAERTHARIAMLSLPVLGEDLDSVPLHRTSEYSAIIRDVAAEEGVTYLPLHERQVDDLRRHEHRPGTQYQDGLRLSSTASTQHFVLRRSFDEISRRRGLRLTTDTVHQNSRGAAIIAGLIAGHLVTADERSLR